MRFQVDRRQVVHETIDGEAILIHMETGFYYSLEGAGAEIWEGLVEGLEPAQLARRLADRYEAPPEAIEEAVAALARELCSEQLLTELDRSSNGSTPAPHAPDPAPVRAHFQPPVLHRYTDMADFMLVDPIHEVEDSGWPNRKVAP